VDQYIVLASEVVIAASIQRRKEHLTRLLDAIVEDTDGRASMSLVEAIGKTETEYNQSVNRQHKLLGDLKQKRSDLLKNQIKENASILNLVALWKEEESRRKLIKLAELRRRAVREESEKLTDIEEVKARILGIDENEI
jgi:phage regulator Rha-like protein